MLPLPNIAEKNRKNNLQFVNIMAIQLGFTGMTQKMDML